MSDPKDALDRIVKFIESQPRLLRTEAYRVIRHIAQEGIAAHDSAPDAVSAKAAAGDELREAVAAYFADGSNENFQRVAKACSDYDAIEAHE